MDFLIATHNLKKQKELQRVLGPLGIRVLTADEAGLALPEVEETGETFRENALLKARSGCETGKMPCIADDSGLCVDALDGAPGVYSARFAGVHGDDRRNNEKLLKELEAVEPKSRTARFVSCVACVFPDGRELTVEGECKGLIGYEPKGDGGFGYDPLFYVGDRSFAELTPNEKDAISHRGNALRKLADELPRYLEEEGVHI